MRAPVTREWTVMFFLASDNPLAPGTVPHLKAMKSAGYHPEVNVIAQFDPNTENVPVHIFDVNRMEKLGNPDTVNIGFSANDSFVRNLLPDKLWDANVNTKIKEMMKGALNFRSAVPAEKLSSDRNPKESLGDFLNFCRKEYPARHYILFLIGHGLAVGDDLFLFDEHGSTKDGNSGPRSLLLKDLTELLDNFNKNPVGKGELELIGFHSCSMSGAEVAFELKGKANYMLASQGTSYLHSWPYRQILIRLFNELGPLPSSENDPQNNGSVNKAHMGDDSRSAYLKGGPNGNGGAKFARQHSAGDQPEFSGVTGNSKLSKARALQRMKRSPKSASSGAEQERHGINGEAGTKSNIRELLISIFRHCLYNSYDFQLAGYSSDLTLCDLSKVDKLAKPLSNLVKTLKDGLQAAKRTNDPLLPDLLVLAHWDAQSFFEERYTDLYDFCLRLRARCRRARSKNVDLKAIKEACSEVMRVLKRGSRGDDDGIIVRCEFCGAASQYSHGLSVFFPWSRPLGSVLWDDQYKTFQFANDTCWPEFLNAYFDGTMRKPQHVEEQEKEDPFPAYSLEEDSDPELLTLLELLNEDVFPGEEQLKTKSTDSLAGVKSGSQDPTGSDCECSSIKNYPPLSNGRRKKGEHVSRPVANLYESFPRFLRVLKTQ
jgi:hypothetical protein